jgi:two-component system, cell cycle response regulator
MLQWTSASERRFTRLGALNDARVLVANPYHGARRAVRAVLEPLGCVVIEAERPAEVLVAARRRRPHVLLLDVAMEREASSSMVAEIKSDPELFAIAIVLVGAHGDAGDALTAMERGAHDVLPDDADAFELAARVRAARRGSDMQELLLTRERELERLAYYDELTGLPNRRSALRQLEALLSRGRRHGHALALLMVDADHFKAVNDRHGHRLGDEVLVEMTRRITAIVRDIDTFARYGGEEFVLILPETNLEGGLAVAEKLRRGTVKTPFCGEDDGNRVRLTVSIGVACFPEHATQPEELLRAADEALYEAKLQGRDRVVTAGPRLLPLAARPGQVKGRAARVE